MKVGRNDPCPCGRGKKYKKCCGDPAKQTRGNREVRERITQRGNVSHSFHKTLIQERMPVELGEKEQGVITPSSEIHGIEDGIWNVSAYIHPQNLRYFALYWDKILLTESDVSVTYPNEEMELLAEAGLLGKYSSRVLVDMSRMNEENINEMNDIYINAMSEIAFEMEKKNPGRWTIHHPDCLTLKGGKTAEMYTAKIDLINCLPLPKTDVRLDNLLDFKMRRESELLGLRLTLAELYGKIASTNDIPHTKTTEVSRLEKAIIDLNRADDNGMFSRFSFKRSTIVDIGLRDVSIGAAGGLVVGAQWTSEPIVGLASMAVGSVAGALSGIKFEIDISRQLSNSTSPDLSYIRAARKEGVTDE